MTAVYPLQNDFSGGELSPRLAARTNTEWYAKSVETMTNFTSTPQGSAIKRSGSEYIFGTLENQPARLVQFSRGRENDYVVEFTNGALRIYNRDGIVQKLGGELLQNRQFGQTFQGVLYDWVTTSNLTTEVGEAERTTLAYENDPPAFKVSQFEFATTLNFVQLVQLVTVEEISPGVYADHTLSTDVTFDGGESELQVNLQIGDDVDPALYANVVWDQSGSNPVTFTPTSGTISVTYRFQLAGNAGAAFPRFAQIQGLSLKPAAADPLIITTGDPVNSSVPWNQDEIFELDTAMDLGGGVDGPDRLWIAHPNYPPHLLVRISQNNWECYDLMDGAAPIQLIQPPASWTTDNYPSTVELFSGRSWFSGVPSSRSQLWASKAGDYLTFTPGGGAGNSLDLQLVTRGAIQWLKGQKALLIGTDLGEHTITSSQGLRTIGVGDADVLEQSSNGSIPVEPIIIGSEVVYINTDRTKLYATDYERNNDGWLSTDLTWAAEHITAAGMVRHVWAKDPNDEIVILMDDGSIVNCIYNKLSGTLAWNRDITDSGLDTQGNNFSGYTSACVTEETGGSSKWYCVRRNTIVAGETTTNFYIESVQAGEVNNQYMDSWVSQATVGKVVDNLDHLEGRTVSVLVNSGGNGLAVEPDKVVVNGQITTEADGTAVVGLGYTATLKTLRQEGGNRAGSSQAWNMGMAEVVLRLNNSAVPMVDGQRPYLRTPQMPQNIPTPLTTGDATTYHLGADNKGQITIEQDLPLRTEVLAWYGKLRSSGV
jgi:hypothetical protein